MAKFKLDDKVFYKGVKAVVIRIEGEYAFPYTVRFLESKNDHKKDYTIVAAHWELSLIEAFGYSDAVVKWLCN